MNQPTRSTQKPPEYMKKSAGQMQDKNPPLMDPAKPNTVLILGMNRPQSSVATDKVTTTIRCFQKGM